MIRTKICGIASFDDLKIAENSGTDAVGFLVGKRHNAIGFISVNLASELCRRTMPFIDTVLVTHSEEVNEIIHFAEIINPNAIQLHSDLSVEVLKLLKSRLPFQKLICKVSICDESAVSRVLELQDYADAILLDSIDLINDRVGGTGIVHNWNISKRIVDILKKPVILAGGLNPENVIDAIIKVRPWAVDINSGVTINGVKDNVLVNRFVLNAKGFQSLKS
ncbi:MAG TPA: phosphoribosylanthranilate isomerase [Prolixibacteraceae bacterium]|nr:phosphoribosylanthranilate isomerase [Prolixibacteraceae bacterium]